MNTENIKKAILVMERAKARDSVDMRNWQMSSTSNRCASNEQAFHACGNTACFAGHIAISPEFQADGGSAERCGAPRLGVHVYEEAIASWLGVSVEIATCLTHGHPQHVLHTSSSLARIYSAPWEDVKAEHVIFALNQLLELGEEECLKLWDH